MPIVAMVAIDLLDMAVLHFTLAPSQHHSPVGQEHSRTIPLGDIIRLGDTPEKRQRPLPYARDICAPGLMLQAQPEGSIDRVVECGLVQPARNGPLLVESFGLVPGCDLGFDLRNIRPPKERPVAVGANNPAVGSTQSTP
jgi:hypothetical protein